MRSARRALLVLAAAIGLSACDDVTEADRALLIAEIQGHLRLLNLEERSGGFYTLAPEDPVRYISMAYQGLGRKQHGVSIWIIQHDDRPDVEGRPVVTDARQVLRHPREFYRANICPPQAIMAPYAEDFEIYINLFSTKFNQQFKVPCL